MKHALVLINSSFPYGTAITSRVLNFCRLLKALDYSVHVISEYSLNPQKIPGAIYSFEGISYQIVTKDKPSSIDSFVGKTAFVRETKKYLDNYPVDMVYMTNLSEMFLRIKGIICKKKIKYFIDQCEWLDISSFKLRYLDPRFIWLTFLRWKGFYHPSGIVSISRLLDEYYKSINVRSIRIPTILDVSNIDYSLQHKRKERIHIVFAGSLGGTKELMKPIIEALACNAHFRQMIVLDIYGPSRNQIIKNIDNDIELLEKAGDSVNIHGRAPQERISAFYKESDYLIFVRPKRKSSNAGFPTKFAESMATGTPVITNITGDIDLYLKDGFNGFMLSDNSTKAVEICFNRMISIDQAEYELMRRAARKTAEDYFDYKKYKNVFSNFIELI